MSLSDSWQHYSRFLAEQKPELCLSEDLLNLTADFRPAAEIGEHKDGLQLARICSQHKDCYEVETAGGRALAELAGNLRYRAQAGAGELPVVGDWAKVVPFDAGRVLISGLLPRRSLLKRKAAGRSENHHIEQAIAANVDCALLLQSRPLNLNRMERYLQLCAAAQIQLLLLLSKCDLLEQRQQQEQLALCRQRFPGQYCLNISVVSGQGLQELTQLLQTGHSYCLLGSSGAGKSSLLNALSQEFGGPEQMATGTLTKFRQGKVKGRHTTSERQLFCLNNGAIFIDNPGMRELGLTELSISESDAIAREARHCRFADCQHQTEPGCAVQQAIRQGNISEAALANYRKLQRETQHYQASNWEKRHKSRKQGKLYNKIQQEKCHQKGRN